MHGTPRFATLMLVLAAMACPTPGQGKEKGLESMVTGMIETEVKGEIARSGIPGLTIAVAKGGGVVYSKAYGSANLESRVPTSATTLFRTASIAKPMTAVAVMQLAEQKKLDLDAPLNSYVDALSGDQWKMTARQLLGHLGGVRHYKHRGEASGTDFYPDLKSTLKLFADDAIVGEPGEKFAYTTYGYTLLGLAIEAASKQSFRSYMKEHVWDKAGMKLTQYDDHHRIIPGRTAGYRKLSQDDFDALPADLQKLTKAGAIMNADFHDTSMKVPGGGLLSTADDLAAFGVAMLENKLVSEESRNTMWTPMKNAAGEPTKYGMGFALAEMGGGPRISHSGGQPGTSTMMMIDVNSKTVVAVMCNLQGAALRGLAGKILVAASGAKLVERDLDYIRVSHILIAFKGAMRSQATRSKEEAEKLAKDLMKQIEDGADFNELMKKHSNDPGGGTYGMTNTNAPPKAGYHPRGGMVPAFGNVGFGLKVGEVGLAPHDARTSPFGWHIIKRVE